MTRNWRTMGSLCMALCLLFGLAPHASATTMDSSNPESYVEIEGAKQDTKARSASQSYSLRVDTINQVVSAYNSAGTLVRQMICSTGTDTDQTPLGTFATSSQYRWGFFTKFNVWAQYWTRIDGPILFHSVLFTEKDESTLVKSSINNLGKRASHGCVRLRVEDAQWIFENCPQRTQTTIFEGVRDSKYTAAVKAKGALAGKDLYTGHIPKGDTAKIKTATGGGLKLRSTAGFDGAVVTTLPDAATVTIISSSGDWKRIYYQGTVGYASAAYLEVTAAPIPTAEVPSMGMITAMGTVVTSGSNLNLRTTPDAAASVICAIPNGAEVGIVDRFDEWLYVFYQAHYGYVSRPYIAIAEDAAEPETQQAALITESATATVSTGNGSMLNLRRNPDTTSPVLIHVPNGTQLSIERMDGNWALVTYGGMRGYVHQNFLVI